MKRLTRGRSALSMTIAPLALLAAGATAASLAIAAAGGLSVSPGIFEHVANRGSVGSIKVSNTTTTPMTVKVTLRPWLQARSGTVSPNRRRTLRQVRLGASSFALAGGSSRTVALSVSRVPRARSLYGAIEVTGAPGGRAGNGIKIAYRLVSSLRLGPPKGRQSFRARAGRLIEQGSVKHGTLLLAVRNTGNTITPIGGTVRVSGTGRSLHANATAKTIVPGHTVNVPLTELAGALSRGRYTVSVTLTQGGHRLGTVRRTVTLR